MIRDIKARRERTAAGLKEAKEALEREYVDAVSALLEVPPDAVSMRRTELRRDSPRGPVYWCPACSAQNRIEDPT